MNPIKIEDVMVKINHKELKDMADSPCNTSDYFVLPDKHLVYSLGLTDPDRVMRSSDEFLGTECLKSATEYALANGIDETRSDYDLDTFAACYQICGELKTNQWKELHVSNRSCRIFSIDLSLPTAGQAPVYALRVDAIKSGMKNIPGLVNISRSNQTIEVGFLQYPTDKAKNADLLTKLYKEKSEKLVPTGKLYSGYYVIGNTKTDLRFVNHKEYEYCGKKYARVAISKESEEGQKYGGGYSYGWYEVKPITATILNWKDMPKEINPKGNGRADKILCMTEKVISYGMPYIHPKHMVPDNEYHGLYFNTHVRAWLGGTNVNGIKDKQGSLKYAVEGVEDFTGRGFVKEVFVPDFVPVMHKSQDTDDIMDNCR